MNSRYVIFCFGKKILLPGCIKNPQRRNVFIALMLPVRHSSYVSSTILRSSMHKAIMIPCNLKTAIGGLVSFVLLRSFIWEVDR